MSLYPDPARSIERFENVATPLTAFTVVVPLSVPAPGLVPIVRVIGLEALVTVCPSASWIVTRTAGVTAAPAVAFDGCTVKARRVAAPAVRVIGFEVTPSRSAPEKLRV